MTRLFILITLIASIGAIVSCSSSALQSAGSPTTASAPPPTQAPSNETQKLNLDDYFPTGGGRDLVLQNCTGCHSFVPIITGQRTKERWANIKNDHRDKAPGIRENDYNALFAYLVENYNNTKPEPKLPDWFLKQQTGTGE